MTKRMLSPEIVSLIHHVELNQSGWWKKAVSQVVKGVLWKTKTPMTQTELGVALQRELGILLTDDTLAKQLEALASQGVVIRLPGPNYKLTESAQKELTASHDEAIKEQEACRAAFLDACAEHCPSLNSAKTWLKFIRALNGAIKVTGANLFHLLADGNLERDVDWFSNFLSKFNQEEQSALKLVLAAFFAPGNRACRNQVLRLLSAHFFAEASQLRPETLALIEEGKKTRSIKIVLDTNFIFSVLGLHDNPGDDAALSLIEVAQKAGKNLDVKFYVLPSTLDEAQRVLLNQMRAVERIRTTRAMAQAALTQPLPSVAKKFFDAASRTQGLTAATFFQPYIDDLRTILRDKGISVLEAHQAVYHQRQDVIDDVLDEQRREETEVPEQKRKSYETLLHDAVLWHAVMDRRRVEADSPFEVEYWAVSIDWRLIAFDRKKRAANAAKMPVVLHPSNLVQLVQFWVPRSAELDESLVDSVRLPMFFQSFDPDDERATVKVLEALSRYENVGDLPEQTLKKVLANQALRGRLRDADASNQESIELVREELLSEHREALSQLEKTRNALHGTQESLETERHSRLKTEAALDAKTQAILEFEAKASRAERLAAEAAAGRAKLEKQLIDEKNINATRLNAADQAERRLVRQQYVFLFLVLPLILGWVVTLACYQPAIELLPTLSEGWKKWAFIAGLGLLPFAVASLISPLYTDKSKHLTGWWLSIGVKQIGRRVVWAPTSGALLAVYQGGAWDIVKKLVGWDI